MPIDTLLDWGDSPGAETYDIYLWEFADAEPSTPTAQGLTTSQYTLLQELKGETDYMWRVTARNFVGDATGDVWSFRTEIAGLPGDPGPPMPPDGASPSSQRTSSRVASRAL